MNSDFQNNIKTQFGEDNAHLFDEPNTVENVEALYQADAEAFKEEIRDGRLFLEPTLDNLKLVRDQIEMLNHFNVDEYLVQNIGEKYYHIIPEKYRQGQSMGEVKEAFSTDVTLRDFDKYIDNLNTVIQEKEVQSKVQLPSEGIDFSKTAPPPPVMDSFLEKQSSEEFYKDEPLSDIEWDDIMSDYYDKSDTEYNPYDE